MHRATRIILVGLVPALAAVVVLAVSRRNQITNIYYDPPGGGSLRSTFSARDAGGRVIEEKQAKPGAVRLTFSYEGNDIKLISRQRVNVVAPLSEPLESSLEGQSGFWVEVRDEAGHLLRRQLMHDPIRRDAEVFSEEPARSVARIPLERPSGVFVVLIPEVEGADHVVLIGTPPAERPALREAREIARFNLAE